MCFGHSSQTDHGTKYPVIISSLLVALASVKIVAFTSKAIVFIPTPTARSIEVASAFGLLIYTNALIVSRGIKLLLVCYSHLIDLSMLVDLQ